MTEEEYQERLRRAPEDHNSEEFLDYLRRTNPIIWEGYDWLIIQNCKNENIRTAFWKNHPERDPVQALHEVLNQYPECEWRKKHASKQSIKRFHIHIINK